MIGRVLLALVLLIGSTGLAPTARAVGEPADDKLATELKFRQDFGLNADPAAVRALMTDPSAYDQNFPVALTSAERAEMARRVAMEAQMTPLEEHARSLPGFAGHWIDQPAGGVIKVALVGATEADRAALEPLVPKGARVEVVPARYTLAELSALQLKVKDEVADFDALGHRIGLIYVDLDTNTVRVGVSAAPDAALAALQARYGVAVSVEVADPVTTACTDRYHCKGPPLRAGIASPTTAAIPCTIAFLITKVGVRGWLTAGHCAPTVGAIWNHDGINIGTIRATCWPQCQWSDAARAGELNARPCPLEWWKLRHRHEPQDG